MSRYFIEMDSLSFIADNHHENLAYWTDNNVYMHSICPPAGYRRRHLNNNGPVRELKDMTSKEIIILEARYGAPVTDSLRRV